jgi:CheY-like chemotaxis protein
MGQLEKKKILVIDDSETNQLLLQAVLEDEGYDVILMDNSRKAIDYIKKHKPDLILLDLFMPEIDGFDFLRRLSNGSSSLPYAVLIVTAYSNRENNEKAKEMGALDVIHKPVNISSLLLSVKQILNY